MLSFAVVAVAAPCVLLLLFVSGTLLTVAHEPDNSIALGALRSTAAINLWVMRLNWSGDANAGCDGRIVIALVHLVIETHPYQIVAPMLPALAQVTLLFAPLTRGPR